MMARAFLCTLFVAIVLLGAWIVASQTHQEPCHPQNSQMHAQHGQPYVGRGVR
jgi:hypothetical protein